MLIQFVGVFAEYWSDDQQLGRLAIERETGALAAGIVRSDRRVAFALPEALHERYEHSGRGYFARVRTGSGTVLFSNCDSECAEHFLPLALDPPNFWMKQIAPGKPLQVAGGRIVDRKAEPILIEVAIVGDRDGVLTSVMIHEVADHMALPMSLLLVVVLGATTASVHRALRPVRTAARLATTIDPVSAGARLPTEGMPQEVAKLTRAVNAAFDRVGELVRGQKIFTAAISHEVRTPLAMASLELEKIEDPRARKVEADLETLNRLVEQLTTLARLDGAGLAPKVDLDPLQLAEGVVSALAPLVYESGRTIGLVDHGGTPLQGYPDLAENALRNLIENAIRHSAPGAEISVEVGPGRMLRVVDRGRARPTAVSDPRPLERSRTGLGLRIVGRIAALHGGSFALATSPTGETVATLNL